VSTQTITEGNNMDVLKAYPDNYFDSVVTDPPYGLTFMGKKWDHQVPSIEFWKEVFRVLKPGGHVLSFGGTRTYHRMVVNIEDAGFEIRDQMQWIYGSGFPKSLDVSKALDKEAGAERDNNFEGLDRKIGITGNQKCLSCGKWFGSSNPCKCPRPQDIPLCNKAKQWAGWGTSLKPANEPICVARKPIEGTVADNFLKWGVGGINIDGCRIDLQKQDEKDLRVINRNVREVNDGWGMQDHEADKVQVLSKDGRFPANIIFNEEASKMLDEQSGKVGASRFFYCAKASQSERNKGLEGFELKDNKHASYGIHTDEGLIHNNRNPENRSREVANHHPTVKPVSLMRYLVRLVTPPGGICLDPFAGSGTTGIACEEEGFNYVLIEKEQEYCKISEARIAACRAKAPNTQINLFE